MAARQGVGFFGGNSHSGHILGINQEGYLDWNIIILTLPGAYAFNGWVDATLK